MAVYLDKNRNALPFYIVGPDGNAVSLNPTGAASNQIQGNVASGSADNGNPVKIGGAFRAAGVTLADGQRGDLQLTTGGSVKVNITDVAGASILSSNYVGNDSVGGFGPVLKTYGPSMVTDGATLTMTPGNSAGAYAQGNVASGTADVGNPVKVGAKYNSTLPTMSNGQRGDLQLDSSGNLSVFAKGTTWVGQDAVPNDRMMSLGRAEVQNGPGYPLNMATSPYVFNPTTGSWDRQRGDANGTYMVGNVASGATDAGNPVKVGAEYLSTAPVFTTGQRTDMQSSANGSLYVDIGRGSNNRSPTADALAAATGLNTYSQNAYFNGTTWDRQKGDITGAWSHAPANTVSTALSGTIATSGATVTVAFTNTTRQEVINPSTSILWASWGATPAVNGAGSFQIAPGGTFSTDRTAGTLTLLSTTATQSYTVNRYT